ncbi:probable DNA-3-methyladenine glycosylase [Anoplophora glabripennis]|uniref:probable DNA-3-methyladenine glycosylase n=1 Tax=Anoplophora glabripennis TaxID=217634 RepID=UPI0008751B8A|nr:probable DNA-3-methyladenine glycosylase [Anoplophora glabripennis]
MCTFEIQGECRRLLKEDFNKSCQDLAIYLLGKTLARKLKSGEILKGQIVETECYLGGEDKASHSYNGNIEPGAVVLLRALEPRLGINIMENYRILGTKRKNQVTGIKSVNLCNGPSKLCIAMNITKQNANKLDLTDLLNDRLWIEDGPSINGGRIVNSTRIGIGPSAEEWVLKPLRYYILTNKSVSKRDKNAEGHICSK